MDTSSEIRRKNLGNLVKEWGGANHLARRLNKSPSQLSQLVGKRPSRDIGSGLAREIERSLGLERGWMDNPHYQASDDATRLLDKLHILPAAMRERIEAVMDLLVQLYEKDGDEPGSF